MKHRDPLSPLIFEADLVKAEINCSMEKAANKILFGLKDVTTLIKK